jgi:hypothetical protein
VQEPDEGLQDLDRRISAAKHALERMQRPPVDVNFVEQLPADRPEARFVFGEHVTTGGGPLCGDIAWSTEPAGGTYGGIQGPRVVPHRCARTTGHRRAHATAASGSGWTRGYYTWHDLPSAAPGGSSPIL